MDPNDTTPENAAPRRTAGTTPRFRDRLGDRQEGAQGWLTRFANRTPTGLKNVLGLERVLAVVGVLAPILMVAFDNRTASVYNWSFRGSISAYNDMGEPQWYFLPLGAAVVALLLNGVVKQQNLYNVALAVLLLGVLIFDRDGTSRWPHGIFAAAFFLGNAAVMFFFSRGKMAVLGLGKSESKVSSASRIGSWITLAVLVGVAVLYLPRKVLELLPGDVSAPWRIDVFWAECASLVAISAHFWLHQRDGQGGYTAFARKDRWGQRVVAEQAET